MKKGLTDFEMILYIILLLAIGGLAFWFLKDKIFGMLK